MCLGSNRGGMEECYHGPCDIYNHTDKNKNNISWDFLVKTTQTLIGEYPKLLIAQEIIFLFCRYSKGSDTIILQIKEESLGYDVII